MLYIDPNADANEATYEKNGASRDEFPQSSRRIQNGES
jgi:hypothetical protein